MKLSDIILEGREFEREEQLLQKELETQLGTDFFKNPYEGYQLYTKADISSTKINLNFKPRFSLEDGIKKYIPEIKRLYNMKVV